MMKRVVEKPLEDLRSCTQDLRRAGASPCLLRQECVGEYDREVPGLLINKTE